MKIGDGGFCITFPFLIETKNSSDRQRHQCTVQLDCNPGWIYVIKGDDINAVSSALCGQKFVGSQSQLLLQLRIIGLGTSDTKGSFGSFP